MLLIEYYFRMIGIRLVQKIIKRIFRPHQNMHAQQPTTFANSCKATLERGSRKDCIYAFSSYLLYYTILNMLLFRNNGTNCRRYCELVDLHSFCTARCDVLTEVLRFQSIQTTKLNCNFVRDHVINASSSDNIVGATLRSSCKFHVSLQTTK